MNTEEGGKIKFHYGFYGAIKLIYESAKSSYVFLQEQQLGDEPVRLDMLIVRKNERHVLTDPIGQFFRGHNILDYKSPDDALNINDFYKSQGYACIYKGIGNVDKISGTELTVSIFRHAYPREMFAALAKEGRGTASPHPGIYHITGPLTIPAQVVVTSQLPEGEYEALKVLTRNANEADVVKFLEDNRDNQDAAEDISAILRVSIAANEALFLRLEKEGLIVEAFERVFCKEFAEARSRGRDEGRAEEREIIRNRLIAGGMTPQEAARYTGLSV